MTLRVSLSDRCYNALAANARRWLLVLVAFTIVSAVLAPSSLATRLRPLTMSATSFASDGVRYAAWQVRPNAPIVTLDTLTGRRRSIAAPAGCALLPQEDHGEPLPTAAGGRFLLNCDKPPTNDQRGVLNVPTGSSFMLPSGGPYFPWREIGSRYVEGSALATQCAHTGPEREPCIALFNLATGAVTFRAPLDVANLDSPGPAAVCPALHRKLITARKAVSTNSFAYQDTLFAHSAGTSGRVEIDSCHQHPKLLGGHGEPVDFDLRGGLLTWDTGNIAGTNPFEGSEYKKSLFDATLTSYRLSTHARHTWSLPRLPVTGLAEELPRGLLGIFGYSTHTANTVFWIATRSVTAGQAIETSSVYAASVK